MAPIEITLPAFVSLLPMVVLLLHAGASLALAGTILATRTRKHDVAVVSVRIAIRKLMTASKGYAIAIRKLTTAGKG
jgi:hypothetical protein